AAVRGQGDQGPRGGARGARGGGGGPHRRAHRGSVRRGGVTMSGSEESVREPVREPSSPPEMTLGGIGGSPGIAVGQVVVVEGGRAGVVHRRIKGHQVEEELGRFDAAVEKTDRKSTRLNSSH